MSSNGQMTMAFWLRIRHVWVHGFLAGLLLGALAICGYYFFASFPSFLPSQETASQPLAKPSPEKTLFARPSVSPQQQLTPEANLELQLTQMLNGIKDTTLKKDLDGLRNLYSLSFPDLPKKLEKIGSSWKKYDYQKMDFKIHEIKPLTDNSATAGITWDLVVKELATGKIKNISKTFEVNFIKEHEQWHIVGLKNVSSQKF